MREPRKHNETEPRGCRKTLLGAAFDAGDADKAEDLATEVLAEGASRWKPETTMSDLESSVLWSRIRTPKTA